MSAHSTSKLFQKSVGAEYRWHINPFILGNLGFPFPSVNYNLNGRGKAEKDKRDGFCWVSVKPEKIVMQLRVFLVVTFLCAPLHDHQY